MAVFMHRMISNLPRIFVCMDRSCFRTAFQLPRSQGISRAYALLAPARSKDFRFPDAACVNSSPAGCSLVTEDPRLKNSYGLVVCQRNASTDKQSKQSQSDKKSLVEARESPYAHLTVGQKVKEVGKDASYTVVIIIGIAVTGLMFYMIGRELLSSQSPSGVYGDALKKCQNSLEVTAALGEPIKGYGETTRRGRRRHVSHTEFEVRGVPHMRMRFYIEGPYKKATVHVEVQKDDSGKFEYRYLVVETQGYPHQTFVLEDAR
ncbi:mitochondrial import inner membrane translocase subunit Tim21-like [Babylonia areolata]|uniref:mitochondrial import inner membrane translocase subunit Tim21-like n=1 Tax=Babylonia areolata TaxID=304850 RepID=UPI003FD46927